MVNLCEECAETGDLCEDCDKKLAEEWSKATCAACGHTRFDHPDRNMGARSNDDWLCHEDDHSCYTVFDGPVSLVPSLVHHEPTHGTGICPRCGTAVAFAGPGHWIGSTPANCVAP